MSTLIDRKGNVVCITCRAAIDRSPMLVAIHYEDDYAWGLMDGSQANTATV